MADATIRINVDGHEAAGSAFSEIQRIAREAGHAFSESGDLFGSSWGKFSELLGPAEGAFHSLFQSLGPVEFGIGAMAAAAAAAVPLLFELGEKATAAGAAIAKTALIMNENAAGVSNMQFAWKAAGGDLDKLNAVVFMFEQRMENSSDAVAKGFKALGLNVNDFANATTTDKILAISEAMRTAGDGTNVAAAAFDIFGKGAKTSMVELMGPLTEMAQRSKEIGATWSDVDAKAALEFEHSLSALKTQTEATWTTLGKDFEPVSEAFVYAWQRMTLAVGNVAYAFDQTITGFGYFKSAWDTFISGHQDDLPKVQAGTKGIIDADHEMFGLAGKGLRDYGDHASGVADLDADLKAKMTGADKALKEELRQAHEDYVKQETERKKVLEETHKVEGEFAFDSMNWIEKVGNNRRDAIDGWKEHSSKAFDDVRKLEHEYVLDSMDWTRKLTDTRDDGDIKWAAGVSKVKGEAGRLWSDYYALIDSRSQTTVQHQISEVDRWYKNEVDKARQAGIKDGEYYDALALLAKTKMDDVRLSHDGTFQAIRTMQNDLTTGWQEHFADTLTKGEFSVAGFANAFEGIFGQIKVDIEKIFSEMLTSIISGFLQPLLTNVSRAASSMSSMLIGALTGEEGGGGPVSWVSGGGGSGLVQTGLGGALASMFGGGVAAGGLAIPGAEFSASAVYGSTAAASGGGFLGSIGAFATNPWTLGIAGAALGIYGLYKLFSGGPDDTEIAGRKAESDAADQIWAHLSADQRKQADGAGWSDHKQAGLLIGLRDFYLGTDLTGVQSAQIDVQQKQNVANVWLAKLQQAQASGDAKAIQSANYAVDEAQRDLETAMLAYTTLAGTWSSHAPIAESLAESEYNMIFGAIKRGPTAVADAMQAAMQARPAFDVGGVVRGPSAGAAVQIIAHDGEVVLNAAQQRNVATNLSSAALHQEIAGLREDMKAHMRAVADILKTQPIMLRHAMRGV